MDWLEAFLAFALTMVVLSTMVTAIMEVLHRLLRSREAGLQLMAARLFDHVIWPRVQSQLGSHNKEQERTKFIEAITSNPVALGTSPLLKPLMPDRIARSNVMEFMERLAGTDVGKALASHGEAYVTAAVNDLSQKYDRFAEGAAQLFYNKARALSVGISFLMAFAINVDAVRLFQTYLHDEPLRQAMIAQEERIVQQMTATEESLKRFQQNVDVEKVAGTRAEAVLQGIKNEIEEVKDTFAGLTVLGAPLGHDYYPFCNGRKADGSYAAPDCSRHLPSFCLLGEEEDCQISMRFWVWFGSVLLAGLLMGSVHLSGSTSLMVSPRA